MTVRILDGKAIAETIRSEIGLEVAEFIRTRQFPPQLAAVLVGDDPASHVYLRNKEKACEKAGMGSQVHRLPASTSELDLLALLDRLNRDQSIHGILVQLPLPSHLDTRRVLDAVCPSKDVDCFAPENVGLLCQGRPRFLPCTPHGVVQLLWRCGIETVGKEVVVVGRSDIVGKPLTMMLMQKEGPGGSRFANATVTCCHSQSRDLAEVTRRADILIAAMGRPKAITRQMVKPGVVAIDVGINRVGDRLVGDLDFEGLSDVASAMTPVPGGIGPLTIAMLLRNTLDAALSGEVLP